VLTSVWEAAGYPWSVRLKALLPAWMPWIRKRFKLNPKIEKQLLSISPRQMDGRLAAKKNNRDGGFTDILSRAICSSTTSR